MRMNEDNPIKKTNGETQGKVEERPTEGALLGGHGGGH